MDYEDEQLTDHFRLSEFVRSSAADRHDLDNTPPPEAIYYLRRLAERLETVRDLIGGPIRITSGYRSPKLNWRVGGSPSSDHVKGLAADFRAPPRMAPRHAFIALRQHHATGALDYDQLIYYPRTGHIHIGIGEPGRGMSWEEGK